MSRDGWTALALLLVPIIVLRSGVCAMRLLARATVIDFGRAPLRARRPLDQRLCGYRRQELLRHVRALSADGLAATRRLLCLDFAFPLLYAPVLVAPLVCEARLLNVPLAWTWALPSGFMLVLCDFVENWCLLRLLPKAPDGPIHGGHRRVQVASAATRAKLALLVLHAIAIAFGAVLVAFARP